jgi:hypothetical protein
MPHAKQVSKRKRSRKTVPALGAAGLALSLASGASAAIGAPAADTTAPQSAVSQAITLAEEEISDVSLATFYVFDKEHTGTRRPGLRLAMAGGAGCAGCGGCGCWTGTYYDSSVFGNEANPPHHPVKPAHKYAHPVKHKRVVKNP